MNGWTISCIADCITCQKHWEGYEEVLRLARDHAKRTGHITTANLTRAYQYSYPKTENDPSPRLHDVG